MAKLTDLFKGFVTGMASHAEAQGAHHKAVSALHKAMADSLDDGDEKKYYADLAKSHAAAAKSFADHCDACAKTVEQCSKATDDELDKTIDARVEAVLSKVIAPDRISAVAPSDDAASFGIRAVPRVGAPPVSDEINKAAIPVEFRHLTEISG